MSLFTSHPIVGPHSKPKVKNKFFKGSEIKAIGNYLLIVIEDSYSFTRVFSYLEGRRKHEKLHSYSSSETDSYLLILYKKETEKVDLKARKNREIF